MNCNKIKNLNTVKQNSEVNLVTSERDRSSVLAQPKDVVSISKKAQSGKTEDLEVPAGLREFKMSLEKLIDELRSTYDDYFEIELGVEGPYNLEKTSNSEIKKKLRIESPSPFYRTYMDVGKVAISNFKRDAGEILDDLGDLKKGSKILDKIADLFQNSGFSRIVGIGTFLKDDGRTGCIYLMGINKDKQMIGIYNSPGGW